MPSTLPEESTPVVQSSRTDSVGAGWAGGPPAEVRSLYRCGYERESFNWFKPKTLWAARNDKLAHWIFDPTNGERNRWIQAQVRAGRAVDRNLTVTTFADREDISFLMLGDTGEGDDSQYHVVRPLISKSRGTAFTYIVSDVVYPAGDIHDYEDKFFVPYHLLPGPIFAVPGNHDWYDGLHGFMTLLCGADPAMRPSTRMLSKLWQRLLLWMLWRRPLNMSEGDLQKLRRLRPEPPQQPSPYFVLELKHLLLVGIDTGIRGEIDAKQAEWLRRVSKHPKDKVLITGKPLVVNGQHRTLKIQGCEETVNSIVENREHRYIATIGGDTHNYQRYPVRVNDDGPILQHIVTGAGGAYTKATHTIPPLNEKKETYVCSEEDFRCYPLRGDSLAAYSRLIDRRFGFSKGLFVIPRDQARIFMSNYKKRDDSLDTTSGTGTAVSLRVRLAAHCVMALSEWPHPLSKLFSEFFDWNPPNSKKPLNPPLFKSFLRVDIRDKEIEIRCYAATGCARHSDSPPLEDCFKGTRIGAGDWSWKNLPLTEPSF